MQDCLFCGRVRNQYICCNKARMHRVLSVWILHGLYHQKRPHMWIYVINGKLLRLHIVV